VFRFDVEKYKYDWWFLKIINNYKNDNITLLNAVALYEFDVGILQPQLLLLDLLSKHWER
jgi:hypothetical protein